MVKRKTAKARKSRKVKSTLTIPELRKSLDYISNYGQKVVKGSKASLDDAAKAFASEWKKVFGKTLSMDTAKSYIQGLKKGFKKTRKMRGGAQSTLLTGAPTAYLTEPGRDIPYGHFTKLITHGFTNPEPAISADYGKFDPVLPYPETGSNRVFSGNLSGGGILSDIGNFASAFTMRPYVAQNPTSFVQDMATLSRGQTLPPGGASYERAYSYQLPPSGVMIPPTTPTYTRTLTDDVKT